LDAWLDAHTHAGTSLFNVQGYGAVGGNVTKDTLAINEAIADLNAEGSGLLWFPPLKAGVTYTSSGIDPITVPCTVAGAGRSSAVTTTVDGDIFTVSAVSGKVDFVNLSIAAGVVPTAGAAIHYTDGYGCSVRNCVLGGTYHGLLLDDAVVSFQVSDLTNFENIYMYGIYRPYSGSLPDSGDDNVIGNLFYSTVGLSGSAGIRLEAHGGMRITANKFLQSDYGIDISVADGASTSACPITGNSIEGQAVNAIRLARKAGGTTGWWANVPIVGNEILTTGTAISIGTGIQNAQVVGGTIAGTGGTEIGVDIEGQAQEAYVQGVSFLSLGTGVKLGASTQECSVGPNQYTTVATPVSDLTASGGGTRDVVRRHRRSLSVSSTTVFTNLYRIDLSTYRACTYELVCDFLLNGVGHASGHYGRLLTREAGNCIQSYLNGATDALEGAAFDLQTDLTTTPGSVYIGFKMNSGAGGTLLAGGVSLIVEGGAKAVVLL